MVRLDTDEIGELGRDLGYNLSMCWKGFRLKETPCFTCEYVSFCRELANRVKIREEAKA